jgi:thioredoxin reductase
MCTLIAAVVNPTLTAITAAGMGCQAAMDAERWLEGQE